jgi:hypothetical protein
MVAKILYFSEYKVTLSLKIIYQDQKLKMNSLFNKRLYKIIVHFGIGTIT